MNCNEAVAALVKSIENGTPLSDEQREHLRSCERCSTLLTSAKDLQALVESDPAEAPQVDASLDAAQREAVRTSRRRVFVLAAAALLMIATAATIYLALSRGRAHFGLGVPELILLAIVLTVVAVPAVAIVWLVRASRHSTAPIYKRLKPGRQLSGVCLGLAERFNLNVTLVRLVFLVAFFADGLGFWIYILLDLAMPVHPADREHLLRFRFKRWLDGRQSERV